MIRVAVIGAGYWGPNLIRNFVTCPDVRLVAVCERDAGASVPKARSRRPSGVADGRHEEACQAGGHGDQAEERA